MRDEDKTKEQLIRELVELRKQLAQAGGPLPISEAVHATDKPDTIEEAAESEERARKVFSAERKEDIWVLIISAITVILGLTGIITKGTFTSLFF
jgi:deoxyribodipyrimidine photolyase